MPRHGGRVGRGIDEIPDRSTKAFWHAPIMLKGAELAHAYFDEAVQPVLRREMPSLDYVAARLGSGSDVLRLDDEISRDHDFGSRLTILVQEGDAEVVAPLSAALESSLPEVFRGWPVRFATSWDGSVSHKVDVGTISSFVTSRLGTDVSGDLGILDWLCLTGQSVLEVTGGPVFHDSTTEFTDLVRRLEWYPHDLWLYVLSSAWARLSQEMPFVGRTGQKGDTVGSRVIAARLARDTMHLAFLLERRWAPYPKWMGTVLAELPTGPVLTARLEEALAAPDWQTRQTALSAAIECLAERQAALGLPSASPAVEPFFNRPFRTTNGAIPTALRDGMSDPEVRRLPLGLGSIEQWCDNVDFLSWPQRRVAAKELFVRLVQAGDASE